MTRSNEKGEVIDAIPQDPKNIKLSPPTQQSIKEDVGDRSEQEAAQEVTDASPQNLGDIVQQDTQQATTAETGNQGKTDNATSDNNNTQQATQVETGGGNQRGENNATLQNSDNNNSQQATQVDANNTTNQQKNNIQAQQNNIQAQQKNKGRFAKLAKNSYVVQGVQKLWSGTKSFGRFMRVAFTFDSDKIQRGRTFTKWQKIITPFVGIGMGLIGLSIMVTTPWVLIAISFSIGGTLTVLGGIFIYQPIHHHFVCKFSKAAIQKEEQDQIAQQQGKGQQKGQETKPAQEPTTTPPPPSTGQILTEPPQPEDGKKKERGTEKKEKKEKKKKKEKNGKQKKSGERTTQSSPRQSKQVPQETVTNAGATSTKTEPKKTK